jgi:hypothetical protein
MENNANGTMYAMPSGAKLYVSVSPYELVIALHDALANEMRGKGLGQLDIVEIQKAVRGEGEQGLNVLVDKFIGVAASKEWRAALFACAEKAKYMADGKPESSVQFKLNAPGYGLFDHPVYRDQAREDLYAIQKAVAEENLRPFAKALSSLFAGLVGKSADIQKSNTATESVKPT